jgi:hypothetical protein
MDKTYQDITIENFKTHRKFIAREVKILSIEIDEECITISYEDADILHIITFPKESNTFSIS